MTARKANPKFSTFKTPFWAKVDIRGEAQCWLWAASRTQLGYGHFWLNMKNQKAHRVAWTLTNGSIPPGLRVLHHCDVRACVNPAHLWLGTQSDNMKDAAVKGRLNIAASTLNLPQYRRKA